MAAEFVFLQEEDVPHRLVRLRGESRNVAARDGGEHRAEGGRGGLVVSRHVPRREHVTAGSDAGEIRVAGVDPPGQLGRSAEEGGDQIGGRVVHRVRDAGPPDHVVSHGSRVRGFQVLPDLGLGFGIEVRDRGVLGIAHYLGGSRDGFVESLGAVGEELDEIGGLDGAGRGAGDAGGFLVESVSVRGADPDAQAEVGESVRGDGSESAGDPGGCIGKRLRPGGRAAREKERSGERQRVREAPTEASHGVAQSNSKSREPSQTGRSRRRGRLPGQTPGPDEAAFD